MTKPKKYVKVTTMSQRVKRSLERFGISSEKQNAILESLKNSRFRVRAGRGKRSHISAIKNIFSNLTSALNELELKVPQKCIQDLDAYLDIKDRSKPLGDKIILVITKIQKYIHNIRHSIILERKEHQKI